jgi:hypothetical protein
MRKAVALLVLTAFAVAALAAPALAAQPNNVDLGFKGFFF